MKKTILLIVIGFLMGVSSAFIGVKKSFSNDLDTMSARVDSLFKTNEQFTIPQVRKLNTVDEILYRATMEMDSSVVNKQVRIINAANKR